MIFENNNNDSFFTEALNSMILYGAFILIISSYSYIYMLLNYPSNLSILRFFDILLWIFPPTL